MKSLAPKTRVDILLVGTATSCALLLVWIFLA